MTVSAPPRTSRLAALRALFEEAHDRARRRRARYAGALIVALLLGLSVPFVLHDGPNRVATDGSPSPAAPAASARSLLERKPYIGVSCPQPNRITCDRVGLAIWLREPVARLSATINGRTVAMHLPCRNATNGRSCQSYCQEPGVKRDQPCGTYYEGFVRPAGMLHGPLKVKPDRGGDRWIGTRAPRRIVRIFARYRGGRTAKTKLSVTLSPGWG